MNANLMELLNLPMSGSYWMKKYNFNIHACPTGRVVIVEFEVLPFFIKRTKMILGIALNPSIFRQIEKTQMLENEFIDYFRKFEE